MHARGNCHVKASEYVKCDTVSHAAVGCQPEPPLHNTHTDTHRHTHRVTSMYSYTQISGLNMTISSRSPSPLNPSRWPEVIRPRGTPSDTPTLAARPGRPPLRPSDPWACLSVCLLPRFAGLTGTLGISIHHKATRLPVVTSSSRPTSPDRCPGPHDRGLRRATSPFGRQSLGSGSREQAPLRQRYPHDAGDDCETRFTCRPLSLLPRLPASLLQLHLMKWVEMAVDLGPSSQRQRSVLNRGLERLATYPPAGLFEPGGIHVASRPRANGVSPSDGLARSHATNVRQLPALT
ncbi:unnamed protein product [Protopolystoma xenopodis]|uniref:Uncharacterized protein n=1 Tax=Protopolystoma xenopodis TaxID=117903 RepID=A0A3S5AZH0_9PLAT|nr:unnamed protein product [Protopolystoma xenopodis]